MRDLDHTEQRFALAKQASDTFRHIATMNTASILVLLVLNRDFSMVFGNETFALVASSVAIVLMIASLISCGSGIGEGFRLNQEAITGSSANIVKPASFARLRKTILAAEIFFVLGLVTVLSMFLIGAAHRINPPSGPPPVESNQQSKTSSTYTTSTSSISASGKLT